MNFLLGPDSSTAITLDVNYDYNNQEVPIRNSHRTKSGRGYFYHWGEFDRVTFGVDLIPVESASIINSWWHSQTELLFFVESGDACEVSSVMITNGSQPFSQYAKPYDNLMNGSIVLETY